MKIAMLNDLTLEIFDLEDEKRLLLPDLLIDLLNINTAEMYMNAYNQRIVKTESDFEKNFNDITQSLGVRFMRLVRNSLFRIYELSIEQKFKSKIHYKNMPPAVFNAYAMAIFTEYITDVVKPLIDTSSKLIMHDELPKQFYGFQTQVKYSVCSIEDELYDVFEFESFEDFVWFAAIKIYRAKIVVKICANCGSLFIPKSRSDEIYCDKITNEGTRTCKQVGYENKNEFIRVYRTAYKARNALKNRNLNNNQHAEVDFKKWSIEAKLKLKESQSGYITFDTFKEWLKQ